jgi:hypothetical protein
MEAAFLLHQDFVRGSKKAGSAARFTEVVPTATVTAPDSLNADVFQDLIKVPPPENFADQVTKSRWLQIQSVNRVFALTLTVFLSKRTGHSNDFDPSTDLFFRCQNFRFSGFRARLRLNGLEASVQFPPITYLRDRISKNFRQHFVTLARILTLHRLHRIQPARVIVVSRIFVNQQPLTIIPSVVRRANQFPA